MAEITAQAVKELRDKTGAGMGDCKKALVEADGDMNNAIEYLRKKGAASAAKRADKTANEGIILAASENQKDAVIVEINCETDFVAKNAEFEQFAKTVVNSYLNNNVNTIEELMKVNTGSVVIEDYYNDILSKFSEKIEVRRNFKVSSNGFVATYNHAGNKLAVLVEVDNSNINEKAHSLIRDIAMQIAAMNPGFISRDQVDNDTLNKEVEIYKQQAIESGKKEEIAERIAQGRLEKYYSENCLLEQSFVKDGNKTITDVVKEISAEAGADVKIVRFLRYALGEATN